MATPTFNNTEIARIAGALWGSKLGSSSMSAVMAAVNTNGLAKVVNDAYNASFGTVANATVAATVVANLGITGAAAAPAVAAVKSTLDGAAAGNKGAALVDLLNVYAGMTGDATYGAFATDFNSKVSSALTYSQTANTVDANFVTAAPTPVTSFSLTSGVDALTGSAGDDTFNAYMIGTSPTLVSGDSVNGGAGKDTLFADMGTGASNGVTPATSNVEVFKVRAQYTASGSADNNVQDSARVDVDAERMVGVNHFESNNSRADLVVEDIRILDAQVTKDITIAMVQSDPGHVDYAVYFDQPSLRANPSTGGGVLNLQLMDTRSALADAATPLLSNPFNGFKFTLGGVEYKIQDVAVDGTGPIDSAQSYAALLLAIQNALAADPALAGVTAAISGSFDATDTRSGTLISGVGKVITLTNAGADAFGSGAWLTADGSVPSSTGLHTYMDTLPPTTSTPLVTSTIILDDVGRGSTGGDLVIGGLSAGETSTSRGVDRFEITVERNSKLEVLASTNDWLKEVQLVNGTTKGNFSALGDSSRVTDTATQNQPQGVSSEVHGAYGFTNVRLIDASTMTGTVTFDAQVTQTAFSKYIVQTDSDTGYAADNANFSYLGGTGNDSMTVVVDGTIAASQSHVFVGLEDFTFDVNGGAGNDTISLRVIDSVLGGGTQAWYTNQVMNDNITVEGGAGNDTVRTPGAGDKTIDLGADDDTVYSDNTGAQVITTTLVVGGVDYGNSGRAEWVFNTADQTAAAAAGTVVSRDVRDLISDTNDSYNIYKGLLTVTYKGVPSTVSVTVPSTAYKASDLQINQAIKQAINTDPVLSKLLLAQDGPSSSLTVKSLIDGVQVAGDLLVSVAAVATGALSAGEWTAAAAAYGIVAPTEALVLAAINAAGASLTALGGDYISQLGNNAAATLAGAASTSTADNSITGGTGLDVIVLGTTDIGNAVGSSNETVVYKAAFGSDTIVHFTNAAAVGAFGDDLIDFTAIGGKSTGLVVNTVGAAGAAAQGTVTSGEISIDDRDTALGGNDTTAKILALFTESVSATAVTQLYIVVNSHNVGTVYQIVDAAGGTALAPNVAVNLMGTIDLADTLWSTMATADFV